jgi:hypothetical protein
MVTLGVSVVVEVLETDLVNVLVTVGLGNVVVVVHDVLMIMAGVRMCVSHVHMCMLLIVRSVMLVGFGHVDGSFPMG